VNVSNFGITIGVFLQHIIMLAGYALMLRHLLGANWRLLIALPTLFSCALRYAVGALASYDALRNQYFFLAEPLLEAIPDGIQNAALGLVTFELASAENAALTYAVFSGCTAAGLPIGRFFADLFFNPWSPSLSDADNYIEDTPPFRTTVANSYLLTLCFGIGSNALIGLLPSGKAHAQRIVSSTQRHRRYALLALAAYLVPTIWATVWDVSFINQQSTLATTADFGDAGGGRLVRLAIDAARQNSAVQAAILNGTLNKDWFRHELLAAQHELPRMEHLLRPYLGNSTDYVAKWVVRHPGGVRWFEKQLWSMTHPIMTGHRPDPRDWEE